MIILNDTMDILKCHPEALSVSKVQCCQVNEIQMVEQAWIRQAHHESLPVSRTGKNAYPTINSTALSEGRLFSIRSWIRDLRLHCHGNIFNFATTLLILVLLISFHSAYASEVKILSPRGGFTTSRVIEIQGTVSDTSAERVTLIMNGVPQTIKANNGNFNTKSVVAPGSNTIQVQHGKDSDKVTFHANVPPKDIKIVLTWDTPTDVDLWVIDPKGEKTYFAATSSSSGGNLDVDVTDGFGPETFTMSKALSGSYAVNVQYYSSNSAPITRVKLYVILYEGTSREERKNFEFVMTRQHQVYHIADFQIVGK